MNKLIENKRVLLRADANAGIGHGHLMRLLALADMLSAHFRCYFVTHNPPAALAPQLQQASHGIHRDGIISVDAFQDVHEEAKYLVNHVLQPDDIFVMDGYQFTSQYQQTIRTTGVRLVCLDDLNQQYFYADAVINPAGGISPAQYQTEIYTRLALGPDFALLRKPFRQLCPRTIAETNNILICFGGADAHNLTQKVAAASLAIAHMQEIHLVTGASYQHRNSLEELAAMHPDKIFVHQQLSAEEMVKLMQHCQIALAPASTVSYELCSVGIGLVTGTSADNQQHIERFLVSSGCALSIGDFHQTTEKQIREAILHLRLATISQQLKYQQDVFKHDTSALIKLFQRLAVESKISCRKARQEDLITYFEWANDPETRQQAIHPEAISLENHSTWFLKKMESSKDFMFIFEQEDLIGQVRFDAFEHYYVISYSVDKQHRGKGLGTILIKMALEALQQELGRRPSVLAYVKPSNPASLKVFEQNGFIRRETKKVHNVSLELFEK